MSALRLLVAIQQMNAMHVRAELRLPPPVSGGQKEDDLVAFAGYCAARIARDLSGIEGWDLDPETGLPVTGSDCSGELAVIYEKL